MNFYSGFSLSKEEFFFKSFIKNSDYCIGGFSKGAIEAFLHVLNTKRRVDTLQLFSPAFFQDKDNAFKRTQLLYFKKDKKRYIENFFKNVAYPSKIDLSSFYKDESSKELEKLLNFIWQKKQLEKIKSQGTQIEVYLGKQDKIIDSFAARNFFKPFATIYFIKDGGHLLHG